MSPLADFVFSPAGLFFLLVAGALWLRVRPASAGARRVLFGGIVFYLLASIYVVPYGIGRLLVVGFREITAADLPDGPTAIVLLGGGSVTVRDWRHEGFSVLGPPGAARAFEASQVYRMARDAWVISSGGAPGGAGVRESDAVVMRDALVQLGVPEARIILDTAWGNTHDEAVHVAPMLRSLHARQVVLVTSDVHMRRSIGAFRAQGVEAIPAIARDPYLSLPRREKILPTKYGLETSGAVAHEVFGIVYYRARGWIRF
jgi:uncharacterized SAM-binding protein YcdF (DUF218 family)